MITNNVPNAKASGTFCFSGHFTGVPLIKTA